MIRKLEAGDKIYVGGVTGYGGHGAHLTIDKVNRRSLKGFESPGSYSAGRRWTVGAGARIAFIDQNEKGLRWDRWGELGDDGELI